MNARNGVMAAEMVQMGFTGVYDTFAGDGNFLVAYADNPRGEQLVAELGSRYEVMLTNIKKFCVGFPIQSPVEGLLLLKERHGFGPGDIEKIVARLPEGGAHTVNDREMPDINLQYIFAIALLDGRVSFEAAHSVERMSDPDVLDLRSRVSLIGDPELSVAQPDYQAIVQVTTRDGTTLEERVTRLPGQGGKSPVHRGSGRKGPGPDGAYPGPRQVRGIDRHRQPAGNPPQHPRPAPAAVRVGAGNRIIAQGHKRRRGAQPCAPASFSPHETLFALGPPKGQPKPPPAQPCGRQSGAPRESPAIPAPPPGTCSSPGKWDSGYETGSRWGG